MISLLLLFLFISLGFSFLCSLWEAVLLSVTPAYAQIQVQKGSATGKYLQEFKQNIDRPLAAILTLNTIAHTVGAIGVGVQAAKVWGDANPLITSLIVPALMTLAILLFSEIVPKTLGATYWKRLAPPTVRALRILIAVLAPLVWMCQLVTNLFDKNHSNAVLSRSDFAAMAKIGAKQGVFRGDESRIITNLMRFESILAENILTPRTVVLAAPKSQPIEEFHLQNRDLKFSRIPVFEGDSKDEIEGYVLRHEIYAALVEKRGADALESIQRPIIVVPEKIALPDLFSRLLEEREHIALVVDEFGGVSGIVTMEDVIETLIGLEIVDESDQTEDMQLLARQNWEKRAANLGLQEDEDESA